ncbi:helix-turn-helix transcriptional regulator [Novosphingobium sp.]|uniref:helix-turn-helix transcriptional regulator n=1 Tax=Novosphingobium sp. TaxID=1874826 RepID=UPI0038BD57BD
MDDFDDRFLRIGDVIKKTGCSRASIYRMVASGAFPHQVPIGRRAVGWRLSAVIEWMESPRDYHCS